MGQANSSVWISGVIMDNITITQQQDVPAKQAALSTIEQIEKLQEEIKALKEMQDSILDDDLTYSNALENRKDASERLKTQKQRVFSENPELIDRQADINEKRQTVRELKSEAGYQLGLFQQQTGASVLESRSGKRYHIVNSYKKAAND